MPAEIPAGGTWFDTLKRSFDDVPVDAANDNGIATSEFLEAAESLTTLFGMPKLYSWSGTVLICVCNRRPWFCRILPR
jgi:hypothetical protein